MSAIFVGFGLKFEEGELVKGDGTNNPIYDGEIIESKTQRMIRKSGEAARKRAEEAARKRVKEAARPKQSQEPKSGGYPKNDTSWPPPIDTTCWDCGRPIKLKRGKNSKCGKMNFYPAEPEGQTHSCKSKAEEDDGDELDGTGFDYDIEAAQKEMAEHCEMMDQIRDAERSAEEFEDEKRYGYGLLPRNAGGYKPF